MPTSIISASGLNKTYHNGSLHVHALKDVNFSLPSGALAMIYGPSGGGKSTLLQIVGGVDRLNSGSLEVAGVALHSVGEKQLTRFRREKTGFIFQFYNLLPSLNALDNVCLPLLAKGTPIKKARQMAQHALQQVGLLNRQKHQPSQLSGGEQQRLAVARALIVQPALVLADEPTGNLDSSSAEEIMILIQSLNKTLGITFLIATHNTEFRSIASNLFEMRDGCLRSV